MGLEIRRRTPRPDRPISYYTHSVTVRVLGRSPRPKMERMKCRWYVVRRPSTVRPWGELRLRPPTPCRRKDHPIHIHKYRPLSYVALTGTRPTALQLISPVGISTDLTNAPIPLRDRPILSAATPQRLLVCHQRCQLPSRSHGALSKYAAASVPAGPDSVFIGPTIATAG